MCNQAEERIRINNKEFILWSRPLDVLLKNSEITFTPKVSTCWRGYIGTWQIINNVLYLVDIDYNCKEEDLVSVGLFCLKHENQCAKWFTGELRVPFGKELYIRGGDLYEHEMIFTVEEGVILNHKLKDNKAPDYKGKELPF